MSPDDRDPTAIRSLAVTADDVVAAVESRFQGGNSVVLRATPPFSGRMRARLHVPSADPTPEETDAAVVDPTDLLDDDAPAYPRAGDTEAELRADPDAEYSVDRHRERHERALDEWREAVTDHVVSETAVRTSEGERPVDVVVLG